ncbi:hypothetical protein [Rugamonas sp.]|uniref:hypothetical protein n=1 Tax=Rugamonas sp. TaxID=1926287 RepID=UPI0025F2F900|nr:hypothetical protein [Rugamonas sp.]
MTFTKFIQAAAVTAALLAAGSVQAAPNLVINGSFENLGLGHPALADGTWSTYDYIQGWASLTHGIEVRNNVAGQADAGKYFVELDTNQNSSMSQDILNTHFGKSYTLTFDIQDRAGVPTSSQGIEVL